MARPLMGGVDNCNFSFDVEVSAETYAALLAEQHLARQAQRERNAVYCSDWLNSRVLPSGAKGYAILIETEHWTVKVQKGNPTRPPLFIEMRSLALHTHSQGTEGAGAEAIAFVRTVLLADLPVDVREQVCYGNERLSRLDLHLDLHLDWQGGWHPTLVEQEHRQFIKPGHAKMNGHDEGGKCTGYDVGKRRIMARIYDKTLQAKEKHLDWYFALVRQVAGDAYDPEQPIWRLEFELKREGITGFRLAAVQEVTDPDEVLDAELEGEDLPTIGTIRKAMYWAEQLWKYLTTRWLRLVVPGEDSNRARWQTHPTWLTLQVGFGQMLHQQPHLSEEKLTLIRAQRHAGYSRIMQRMGLGLAETATTLMHSDPASVIPAFLENTRRIAQRAALHQAAQRQGRMRRSAEAQQRYN